MAKKVYFVGDTAGSWVDDMWPENAAFDMAAFAQEKPVREAELNLIQQNEFLKLRNHIRRMITDGWTLAGAFSFPGTSDNRFLMAESWFNEAGIAVHVGNPAQTQNAATIQLPAPPSGGGTATDLVYLEAWIQEVSSGLSSNNGGATVDSTILTWGGLGNAALPNMEYWTTASIEGSRRLQIRWAIRTVRIASNASQTLTGVDAQAFASSPTSYAFATQTGSPCLYVAGNGDTATGLATFAEDGYVYGTLIAAVARTGGVTVISSSAVTDLRYPATLQSGIVVPVTNIYPQMTVDAALLHVAPTHVIYTGTQLAGYTPPSGVGFGSATLPTSSAAYATRVTLPAGAQPVNFLAVGGTEPAFDQTKTAVTRIAVFLSKVGNGSNVTVSLYSDGGTVPGSTLLASSTIPASWLTTSGRMVSFPIPTQSIAPNVAVWVVVSKSGTAGNDATLLANANTDANANAATASDGVTWTASGALPFQCAIYTGTSGDIVHVTSEDFTETTLFEYDVNDNIVNVAEYYHGSSAAYDTRLGVYYNADGAILDIT